MEKNTPLIGQTNYEKRKASGLYRNWAEKIRLERGDEVARVYQTWVEIKRRCKGERHRSNICYLNVSVCGRWLESFEHFLQDMGLPEKGFSIDRIDSSKDYEPENCRWATALTQARNRKGLKGSPEIAKKVREIYANEKISQEKLGMMFEVSQVTVSQIIRGKIWN